MSEHQESSPPDDTIKNLLKTLPKVQVSDDFERNLQRRFETGAMEEVRGKLSGSIFRIPALSYSIAALVIVGAISAYLIFKFRTFERSQSSPVPTSTLQPVPENRVGVSKPDSAVSNSRGKQVASPSGGEVARDEKLKSPNGAGAFQNQRADTKAERQVSSLSKDQAGPQEGQKPAEFLKELQQNAPAARNSAGADKIETSEATHRLSTVQTEMKIIK